MLPYASKPWPFQSLAIPHPGHDASKPWPSQTLTTPPGAPCRVDLVLVGAEAVVENGGVINKLGTYQVRQWRAQPALPCCRAALRLSMRAGTALEQG